MPKLFGAALAARNKRLSRERRSRGARRPAAPAPRKRRASRPAPAPAKRRASAGTRPLSLGGAFGVLRGSLVPAVGIALSGLAVGAASSFLNTPMKRAAGATGMALLLPIVGPMVGLPRGLANGLAVGVGIDAAWRVSAPARAGIPALGGGGPSGGLLAGSRVRSGAIRPTRDTERAAFLSQ